MKKHSPIKSVMTKLATEPQKVELSVDSELDKLISKIDNSKKASKDLLSQAEELTSSIGQTLYRAQVNISGDAQALKKVDGKLGDMYKELKGYDKQIDALLNKVQSAEKQLGNTREISSLYKKINQLRISLGSGTMLYGRIGDKISQRLREASEIKKI